jgi:hypothetical protein
VTHRKIYDLTSTPEVWYDCSHESGWYPTRERRGGEVMGGSFAEAMFSSHGERFGMSRERSKRAYVKAWEKRQADEQVEQDDDDQKQAE